MKEEILYRVYVIHIKDADKYYVGITKQKPYKRFKYRGYMQCPGLWQYIKSGYKPNASLRENPNIEIEMTEPLYTEKEARFIEDWFITAFKPGKCVNTYRSGFIKAKDSKKWDRDFQKKKYKLNPQKYVERSRTFRSTPEGKIYNRVCAFNHRHPGMAIETPLEAKQKYLEWGYIPDYIKSDDLTAS